MSTYTMMFSFAWRTVDRAKISITLMSVGGYRYCCWKNIIYIIFALTDKHTHDMRMAGEYIFYLHLYKFN